MIRSVLQLISAMHNSLKTIELEDCYFVLEQESTRGAITQWLGQDISPLHIENSKDDRKNHWIFKIKEQASFLGKKRKYSEVDNEEDSHHTDV